MNEYGTLDAKMQRVKENMDMTIDFSKHEQTGSVVGVLADMIEQRIFFYLDGVPLGHPYVCYLNKEETLYPAICVNDGTVTIRYSPPKKVPKELEWAVSSWSEDLHRVSFFFEHINTKFLK